MNTTTRQQQQILYTHVLTCQHLQQTAIAADLMQIRSITQTHIKEQSDGQRKNGLCGKMQ